MEDSNKLNNSSDDKVVMGSERSFGIVFGIFFCVVGLFPLLSEGNIRWWAIIAAGIFFVFSLIYPKILFPLNFMWMRFGRLLHKIVSPIVLSLVYFMTVVPIGFIMRILGKDILNLKLDRNKSSYWIARTSHRPKKESLKNQF